jgi:hypothetical protein
MAERIRELAEQAREKAQKPGKSRH